MGTAALPEGEPAAGPWRTVPVLELVELLGCPAGDRPPGRRPRVVAVDGRSGSGKSTLAALLAATVSNCAVVHTDDLAWHEPYFSCGPLLADQVLAPLHRGDAVDFRPPAWRAHGREGAVIVPAGLGLLVVEGVGAGQHALAHLVDVLVWVQSDPTEAERRGLARDLAQGVNGDLEATTAFWHEWMAEELVFLRRERPWERADVVVWGTPTAGLLDGQVVVAPGPLVPGRLGRPRIGLG